MSDFLGSKHMQTKFEEALIKRALYLILELNWDGKKSKVKFWYRASDLLLKIIIWKIYIFDFAKF